MKERIKNHYHLPEQDVYDIKPLVSMNNLLVPEHSLCIVHNPCGGKTRRIYDWHGDYSFVRGVSNSGAKEELDIYTSYLPDLGRYKCKLDKHLFSAFLFVSWRKNLGHTFRMFQQHKLIAEFPDLRSAMAAYMPEDFTPQKHYRLKLDWKGLWFCILRYRNVRLALLRLLYRRLVQLSAEVGSEFNVQDTLKTDEEE